MKWFVALLLVLVGFVTKAQLPSSTFPSRTFNGNTRAQWTILDSPLVNPILDTFYARYSGTQIVRTLGTDTAFWFNVGRRWFRGLQAPDTVSLSGRINLKLNIADTLNKWMPIGRRVVDTLYSINDSTVGYTINGASYSFEILGRVNGGGGGSGLTSVGLSMPSAFTVLNSPLTSNGDLNVVGAGTALQYIRGNGTLATFDTAAIPAFSEKVRGLFSGTSPIVYSNGQISILNATASGQKGAATFNNSDFSDNGSGTISLSSLVSAGSCTGCALNIDDKGRITGYSTGTGGATNNVNIGTGFRAVNQATQEMRTYFGGFGTQIDSVANTNGLTWSSDTTRSSGLPTYWYVDSISAAQIGDQSIQETLNIGDTTNRGIYYNGASNDVTPGMYSYFYLPSNINTVYTSHGVAMGFSGGWQRFNGVNTSPRPNVVATILGYNHLTGGGRVNTSEAGFGFRSETHFETGGQDLFEFHMPEITTYDGTIYRPFSLYTNKETGATAYNLLAIAGFNTAKLNGDGLFSFNENGNYSFIGYGSSTTLTLFDESISGNRYQLQVEGTDVYHNSFGNLQRFDGSIMTTDAITGNPHINIIDHRDANNISSILMDLQSANTKRPINIAAACDGGIESFHANSTGDSKYNLTSTTGLARQAITGVQANTLITGNNTTGSTYVSISNTSTTNPGGSGYNFGAVSLQAGNSAVGGELTANFGQGAETRYANTGLVLGTVTDHPLIFSMGVAGNERARLTHGGNLMIGTAVDGGEKLQVAGAVAFDLGSDATGDIFYRNSGGAFTRLGIGSSGQVLKVNSGIPAWQNEVSFSGIAYGNGTSLSAAAIGDLLQMSGSTLQFHQSYMTSGPNSTILLKSRMKRSSYTVPDADFSGLSTRQEGYYILPDITANRTFSLFGGTGVDGEELYIYNGNTSGTFGWSFTGVIPKKASDGSAVANLVNGVLYHLLGVNSGSPQWIIVNQ